MDLVDFVNVLRKWKWLLIAVAVIIAAAISATGLRSVKQYTAESSVIVGLNEIAQGNANGISLAQSGDRIATTYSELVKSPEVMKDALQKAGLNWRQETLEAKITTSVVKDTSVMTIDVTDSDAKTAETLSNDTAQAFTDYINNINKQASDQNMSTLTQELTDTENQIKAASGASQPDQGKIGALQDRRDVILKDMESTLDLYTNASNVKVLATADTSAPVGVQASQRIELGLIIGLVAGIVAAFIAEGVNKAVRKDSSVRKDA